MGIPKLEHHSKSMSTRRPHLFLSLLLVVATFIHLHRTTASSFTTYGEAENYGDIKAIDYIRTSCNVTLYPDVCFTSLSRYANAVQQNPAQLARVAIALTLSKAHHMASYINNLTREADYSANSRATSALHDCFSNLGDAVDEIRGSLKQMRQIGGAGFGGESFRFQMSNVQTWMSAALTDEETCTDGFEDVPDGTVKTDVCNRVTRVKKFTSNALALVNSYADQGIP